MDKHNLPWERDDRNSNYIFIKQWITDENQLTLFEDTKKQRERERIADSAAELMRERETFVTEERRMMREERRMIADANTVERRRERDHLPLVRNKSI